jgi:siroheme synthase
MEKVKHRLLLYKMAQPQTQKDNKDSKRYLFSCTIFRIGNPAVIVIGEVVNLNRQQLQKQAVQQLDGCIPNC